MEELQEIMYLRKVLGTLLDPEFRDSIKATCTCSYCCTVMITVIIHPTHLTGEGDCETQRDNVRKKCSEQKDSKDFPDLETEARR